MVGKIFNVQSFSTTDGPGIRTVVFFQGCNLRCLWCHNPESWQTKTNSLFLADKCIGCGACSGLTDDEAADVCFSGAKARIYREFTIDELWKLIEIDLPYTKKNGGITFSGGECMLQTDFLCDAIKKCKESGLHTAVDTAGHVPYEWLKKADPDLFIYDIKAVSPKVSEKLTGADSILIWENLTKLVDDGYNVQVRVPCIPKANWNELPKIADKLKMVGIHGTELIPYHKLGEGKVKWAAEKFDVPSDEDMEEIKALFKS